MNLIGTAPRTNLVQPVNEGPRAAGRHVRTFEPHCAEMRTATPLRLSLRARFSNLAASPTRHRHTQSSQGAITADTPHQHHDGAPHTRTRKPQSPQRVTPATARPPAPRSRARTPEWSRPKNTVLARRLFRERIRNARDGPPQRIAISATPLEPRTPPRAKGHPRRRG